MLPHEVLLTREAGEPRDALQAREAAKPREALQARAEHPPGELNELTRGRAEQVGRLWAVELRAALVSEKRRASGGWPGTLREARTHVAISLIPWLQTNGQAAVTSQQCEGAARLVYASARKVWLENRDPEDDD